jgi:hypothetical protein
MTQARVRRRGGLVPRLIFAVAVASLVVEIGLRFVLGNGGQGLVIRPARTPAICWELIPGARSSYTGDSTRQPRSSIQINSVGARGDEPDARGPDRLRVAVLGDGLVFGQGVADDETLGAAIGAALATRGHPSDVLSFGVPGISPAQSVATFAARVAGIQPDIVLLVVSPDDLDSDASDCPHDGVVIGDGKVSAASARDQLLTLVATRSYAARAWRLVQKAGWPALLDAHGPWGPGRERMGSGGPPRPSSRASAARPPGPWFAATGAGDGTRAAKRLWGDVPILLPKEREVPAVVPVGEEEYEFVEAVRRLEALGLAHDVQVVVAVASDRGTFERVTTCNGCRPPQALLSGLAVRTVDLSALWLQLLREPDLHFQRGEGFPTAAGYAELGGALGGELAGLAGLR